MVYVERALHAGARGFIVKTETAETIIKAIQTVLAGGMFLSSGMQEQLIHSFGRQNASGLESPLAALSDRELEVFTLIADGRSLREAAGTLNLSVKTVETHVARIKRKLQLASLNELVHFAVRWGAKSAL
jgi:DNA-binding NarL/FixJ family response regulator